MSDGDVLRQMSHQDVFDGGLCHLEMSNQDVLSEHLEYDPFLNSSLQRFTCKLCYRFGSFLAPALTDYEEALFV